MYANMMIKFLMPTSVNKHVLLALGSDYTGNDVEICQLGFSPRVPTGLFI